MSKAESDKSAPKDLAAVANQSSDLVQPFHQPHPDGNQHGVINEHEDEYAEESDIDEERKHRFGYADDDGAEL